jgi:hypothetical protein
MRASLLPFGRTSVRSLHAFALLASPFVYGCAAEGSEDRENSDPNDQSSEDLSTSPGAKSPAPRDLTRFITCPVKNTQKSATASFRGKSYVYRSDAEMRPREPGWEARATINPSALDGLVPASDRALVIDIRRVAGKPAYAYYGAHDKIHETYEPWSSAKFIAASSAMARARVLSQSKVGGPARASAGAVGDLITAMESYSNAGGIPGASNEIAGYFLTVAGARPTNELFGARWLNLSGDTSGFRISPDASRTRSSWGAVPYAGGNTWTMPDGKSVTFTRDTAMTADKPMSAMAEGEWLKRLSQHEIAPESSLPGIQRADVDTLFYGRPGAATQGGMLAGVSNYVANAIVGTSTLNEADTVKALDIKNGGKSNWRIFDKVGWGDSTSRGRSEVVLVSYMCLPEMDEGREVVIVLRTSIPTSSVDNAGKVAQATMNKLVGAALEIR